MDVLDPIKNTVREQAKGDKKPFATLDFDNTCIYNDVAEATLAHICKNKLLKSETLLPAGEEDYQERVFRRYYELLETEMLSAYLFCAKVFAGFTPEEAEKIVADAISAEGSNLESTEVFGISVAHGLAVRPVIKELISFLEEENVSVWIVSASPAVAVKVAMKHFGIRGELIGLQNRLVDGVFSEEIIEPYSIERGKVECIKKYISSTARPIVAAGDSMNDLPMLEYAGIKVVADRGNALSKTARAHDWLIV